MRQWLSLMLAPFVFTACSDPATLVTAPRITALYGKPAETSLYPYPLYRYTPFDAIVHHRASSAYATERSIRMVDKHTPVDILTLKA